MRDVGSLFRNKVEKDKKRDKEKRQADSCQT